VTADNAILQQNGPIMTRSRQPSAFEVYADEYDLITNAAARETHHAREVQAMIDRFHPARVLDAGCASGLTTRLFARQEVEAVGLDCQTSMIQVAKDHPDAEGLPVTWVTGRFESLPRHMTEQFDLVVCLANAITGVGSRDGVRRACRSFLRVLRPGGWLVLQALNYSVIGEGQVMPIKATENEGIVYERFSERRGRRLSVYVTRLDLNQRPPAFEVFRHEFDNFDPEYLIAAAEGAGFSPIQKFGNLLFTRRFGRKSRDLVLAARRPR
jgi:SAM-dependent methyltransferase